MWQRGSGASHHPRRTRWESGAASAHRTCGLSAAQKLTSATCGPSVHEMRNTWPALTFHARPSLHDPAVRPLRDSLRALGPLCEHEPHLGGTASSSTSSKRSVEFARVV
jgi:hypothetical protein